MENLDFDKFSADVYRGILHKLQEAPESVPLGGVYYGQIRCGDICYYANIGHVPPEYQDSPAPNGRDELQLAFLTFIPSDAMAMGENFYMDVLDGHRIDYIHDADITFSKKEIEVMPYEDFKAEMEKMVGQRVFELPDILREPSSRTTAFWKDVDRYDKGKDLIPELHVIKTASHGLGR